jgi:hypothetical protein
MPKPRSQSLEALEKANRVRLKQAGFKKLIAEREIHPFAALKGRHDLDPEVGGILVERFLMCCPGVGAERLRRVKLAAQYKIRCRLYELSDKQVAAICDTLPYNIRNTAEHPYPEHSDPSRSPSPTHSVR